jgi:hypothetical protein
MNMVDGHPPDSGMVITPIALPSGENEKSASGAVPRSSDPKHGHKGRRKVLEAHFRPVAPLVEFRLWFVALALRIRLECISRQGDIPCTWCAKGNRDAQRQCGAQCRHGTPPGVVSLQARRLSGRRILPLLPAPIHSPNRRWRDSRSSPFCGALPGWRASEAAGRNALLRRNVLPDAASGTQFCPQVGPWGAAARGIGQPVHRIRRVVTNR